MLIRTIKILALSKAVVLSMIAPVVLLLVSWPVYAERYQFDSVFLRVDDSNAINLEHFSKGSNILPGTYPSMIYVNDSFVSNSNVTMKEDINGVIRPCLTPSIISRIEFNSEEIMNSINDKAKGSTSCVELESLIPDSSVNFDSNELRLNIYIPQIHMKRETRGSVEPELWDSGIPTALLTYNVIGFNSDQVGQSLSANFNAGFNIGAWYLRQNSRLDWSENSGSDFNIQNTYLERAVPELKGRVLLGQVNTQGQFFDSVPITGFQFNSDNQMLPTSQRGYAPEIRGVARTTAKVTVKQNDDIIYETTVSPGEFLINDLYPTGYGGNLEVTVTESDGSVQSFLVPYAAIVQLIRPGAHNYSAVIGQYRNDNLYSSPTFFEGTYQRGLSNSFTGYGGVQANQDYLALKLGAAFGTTFGSFSADITQSYARMLDQYEDQQGQSYEARYSKNITATGSDFSLAAYRYTTEGYMDYQTAMTARDSIQQGYGLSNIAQSKNRFVITAGQLLPGNWGQFYISGSFENYWRSDDYLNQYQLGYSNSHKHFSWGLNISRNEDASGESHNYYSFNFSMPLGSSYASSPTVRMSYNADSEGNERGQINISDTFGEDDLFNYGITTSHANRDGGTTTDVNLGYISPYSRINANASVGSNYKNQSIGLSGSVVAHAGGITLSPYSANTSALVEAKGAEGATVSGTKGIKIDGNGYALVPNLQPYQMNEIYIDPKGASPNIEFVSTSQKSAPYSNAVVLMKFQTKVGIPLLFNTTNTVNTLPFGVSVFDESGKVVGHVDQGGQVYARVSKAQGVLLASWGKPNTERCVIAYSLTPEQQKSNHIQSLETNCGWH